MYVACRPLKVGTRTVNPGEPVPEAADWQECVRRSHLNLGWIKEDSTIPCAVAVPPGPAKDGDAQVKPKPKKKAKTAKIAS
jgi:hypothetical protein